MAMDCWLLGLGRRNLARASLVQRRERDVWLERLRTSSALPSSAVEACVGRTVTWLCLDMCLVYNSSPMWMFQSEVGIGMVVLKTAVWPALRRV